MTPVDPIQQETTPGVLVFAKSCQNTRERLEWACCWGWSSALWRACSSPCCGRCGWRGAICPQTSRRCARAETARVRSCRRRGGARLPGVVELACPTHEAPNGGATHAEINSQHRPDLLQVIRTTVQRSCICVATSFSPEQTVRDHAKADTDAKQGFARPLSANSGNCQLIRRAVRCLQTRIMAQTRCTCVSYARSLMWPHKHSQAVRFYARQCQGLKLF